ncbi:penicillin-binding transpeptidase domain-containing protein [Nocardioides sp.]|uniref:penicillin-binding transpeptidase domain-containing protein n=1 Tax=Nocardioides sp. TaxID=35761 RepID=UPI0031FF315B|nr:penicillin-binding protein transpeptidase [Nocardioides sp.]
MQVRRLAGTLPALLLLGGALMSCDSGADKVNGPDPGAAAEGLAQGLGSGDLSDVAFTKATPAEVTTAYDAVVAGMGDVQPSVTVGNVDESGDSATAHLTWSWPVGVEGWSYETKAPMSRVGDVWQVVWAPTIIESSLGGSTTLDLTSIAARRGLITGARGVDLVTQRPVVRLGIDRSQVPPARVSDSARRLATLVGIDVADYVKRVEAAGAKAYVEAIVYRRDEVPPQVGSGYQAIDGVLAIADELPLAPTKEFAAPILGSVGEVTAEMIKKDPEKYHLGDEAGLSGLQARYDDQLRGTPGLVVNAVGSDGKERELFRVDAKAGAPLQLTLDRDLQLTAERLLVGVGPASALVAIRPSNGAIVAAANGPGNGGYNMATYGQFAPGSTFKTVSSLALLRSGLNPDSVVPCTTSITVDGKRFENYDDYPSGALGQIPLRTAVANSCNTAFISQTDRLQGTDLFDAAASLGLGLDHDLGFPAYFGSVEPAKTQTEAAADMIGQGTILASPMVMATVIASIQQGGLVIPRMVESVDVSPPDGAAPLSRAEASQLKAMLRGVVTSGSGAGLADVPGPPVIAKTGTAEFSSDAKILTHAWMIAAQGDLAVAVFVDLGSSGSGTAGPILESFLRAARP